MSFFILPYAVAGVLWLRNRDEWKSFVRLFVGLSVRRAGDLRTGARRAAVGGGALHARRCRGRTVRPALHVPVRPRRARRRPARRHAEHPARRQRLDRAHRRSRLGQAQPAHRQRTDRSGPGEREPGGGDPVVARGHVGGDRGVPLAPRAPHVATAAGGLSAGHGVHAGLHRRALCGRRAARVGAGRGGHRRPEALGGTAAARL